MAIAYWNLVLAGRFKFLDLWNKFLVVSVMKTFSVTLVTSCIACHGFDAVLHFLAGAPQKINS